MYSDSVNGLVDRHPLELPEPVGPIVHLQEKLFVPVKEFPDVSSRHCKCITAPILPVLLELIFRLDPENQSRSSHLSLYVDMSSSPE